MDGPLTDTLTGCAEKDPMTRSPTLQPQRGAGGKSLLDELVVGKLVVDKLADEIAVDAHRV